MKKTNVLKLTLSSVFIAIIAVMSFTPLGYLKVGVAEITLLIIPVAAGGVLLGKWGGLLLGTAFGVSSFIQCFGMSAFGTTLFSINAFATLAVCLLPRMLAGFLGALIFEVMPKKVNANISAMIAFLATSLLNGIGFVSFLLLFFSKTDYIISLSEQLGAKNILHFAVLFVGVNFVVESVVNSTVGLASGGVLLKLRKNVDLG